MEVDSCKAAYLASDPEQKRAIIEAMIRSWKGQGGRFLKRDPSTLRLVEAHHQEVKSAYHRLFARKKAMSQGSMGAMMSGFFGSSNKFSNGSRDAAASTAVAGRATNAAASAGGGTSARATTATGCKSATQRRPGIHIPPDEQLDASSGGVQFRKNELNPVPPDRQVAFGHPFHTADTGSGNSGSLVSGMSFVSGLTDPTLIGGQTTTALDRRGGGPDRKNLRGSQLPLDEPQWRWLARRHTRSTDASEPSHSSLAFKSSSDTARASSPSLMSGNFPYCAAQRSTSSSIDTSLANGSEMESESRSFKHSSDDLNVGSRNRHQQWIAAGRRGHGSDGDPRSMDWSRSTAPSSRRAAHGAGGGGGGRSDSTAGDASFSLESFDSYLSASLRGLDLAENTPVENYLRVH
jgi:hypothetical protein